MYNSGKQRALINLMFHRGHKTVVVDNLVFNESQRTFHSTDITSPAALTNRQTRNMWLIDLSHITLHKRY